MGLAPQAGGGSGVPAGCSDGVPTGSRECQFGVESGERACGAISAGMGRTGCGVADCEASSGGLAEASATLLEPTACDAPVSRVLGEVGRASRAAAGQAGTTR